MSAWQRVEGTRYRCTLHNTEFSVTSGTLCPGCTAHPKRDAGIEVPDWWTSTTLGGMPAFSCTDHSTLFLADEACRSCVDSTTIEVMTQDSNSPLTTSQ